MAVDSQSRYALKRFFLKLLFLSIAALVQTSTPWGFKTAATALAILSAVTDAGLASLWRERPMTGALNYWDEAAVFAAVAACVQLLP
jgi:hypothetical protein